MTAALTPAELLRDFVNTRVVDAGTDALATPDALAVWLDEHRLLPAAGPPPTGGDGEPPAPDAARVVPAGEHERALALREAIRSALLAHHDGGDAGRAAELELIAADLPLRLALPASGPVLVPAVAGVRGALAGIVAAVAQCAADGTWDRLKACPADDCQWAFVDLSRNRSRTWCSMQVCGNRAKTRAFRTRHPTS